MGWSPISGYRFKNMEDWHADLSPCNFATTHFPAERSSLISLQLRYHPFDSLHSEVLSPLNLATHEMEDPSATPHWRMFRILYIVSCLAGVNREGEGGAHGGWEGVCGAGVGGAEILTKYLLSLQSGPPATGLRKPESPGRVPGTVAGKGGIAGRLFPALSRHFWGMRALSVRYFRKPLCGPPDPRGPKTPLQQKKESPRNPKTPTIPKSKRSFHKSKRSFPKVNARSLKVNVKYF